MFNINNDRDKDGLSKGISVHIWSMKSKASFQIIQLGKIRVYIEGNSAAVIQYEGSYYYSYIMMRMGWGQQK